MSNAGLIIAPENVQESKPWKSLGHILFYQTIRPKTLQINPLESPTLNNLQQPLGVINWIRPSLGITTHQLTHLFDTVKGDSNLNSPRTLSPQALQELDLVNQHINKRHLTKADCQFPIRLFCFPTLGTPTGLIGQLLPVRHDRMVISLPSVSTYYYHLYYSPMPTYY